MANWFIAFPVAPASWFDRVVGAPPHVRLFSPEDLHLTVAFLGAVDEARARRAWEALAQGPALAPHDTVVSLGAVVPMGDPRKPSALSAELARGRAAVEAHIGAARDLAFDAAGARRDVRPPHAHVTVARPPRGASSLERAAAVAWAGGLVLGDPEVTLDRVALYTWSIDRKVRQFRVVAERPLER